ncbi:MAG: glycosyltransferase family 4 protein [Lachnospiraceae bacterium]|nr:glycosyltransferase family 4 protein [Lachnospiraceae bacterium]
MNIFHINSYFVSRNLYKNIYDHQIAKGDHIKVFVPVSIKRTPAEFDRGNYTDISYNFSNFDRYFFFIKHFKIYQDYKRKYAEFPYEIMHAHSLFSNGFISYLIKRDRHIPYITAVRDTDVNSFFKYRFYLRGIGNKILSSADRVIFLSASYRDQVVSKYVKKNIQAEVLEKSVVIPNGISDIWLRNIPDKDKKIKDTKSINIICTGIIDKRKNCKVTVEACRKLIEKGFSVQLTFIGKVIDQNIYEAVTKHSFVRYLNPTDAENLIKIYADQDIFVMPSRTETFGLVYAEAISQGLPVVYTKGQGFDGQFEDGYVGYAADSGNPADVADKIEKILKNYDVISNNCKKAAWKFDWKNICAEYDEIYKEIALPQRDFSG